jgi:hypothetical protein
MARAILRTRPYHYKSGDKDEVHETTEACSWTYRRDSKALCRNGIGIASRGAKSLLRERRERYLRRAKGNTAREAD